MSENLTKNLLDDGRSFEQQVLANLARIFNEFDKVNARLGNIETRLENVEIHLQSLDVRLTTLEEKVDSRLRETRPIWEAMQNMLEELAAQMKLLVSDSFKMRARIERMEELQRPPAA